MRDFIIFRAAGSSAGGSGGGGRGAAREETRYLVQPIMNCLREGEADLNTIRFRLRKEFGDVPVAELRKTLTSFVDEYWERIWDQQKFANMYRRLAAGSSTGGRSLGLLPADFGENWSSLESISLSSNKLAFLYFDGHALGVPLTLREDTYGRTTFELTEKGKYMTKNAEMRLELPESEKNPHLASSWILEGLTVDMPDEEKAVKLNVDGSLGPELYLRIPYSVEARAVDARDDNYIVRVEFVIDFLKELEDSNIVINEEMKSKISMNDTKDEILRYISETTDKGLLESVTVFAAPRANQRRRI